MANGLGAQSKDDEPYAIPRRQGAREEQRAEGIAMASRSRGGRRGGTSRAYDDRSRDGLSRQTEARIRGRSEQGVLIAALHRPP